MHFPVYRKYKNNQSYFRISSPEELEELKLMGRHYQLYRLKATILPERVFIGDLLNHYEAYCTLITASEYEDKLAWCQENLKLLT